MRPYWQQDGNKIYQGHVLDILKGFEPGSVQCVVTSPPYWGLRDYGLPPMIWDADEDCRHVWGDESFKKQSPQTDHDKGTRGLEPNRAGAAFEASQGQFCQLCGAWRGSLGLEPTPELFIQHIVEIFREVKRVMRSDAVCFLNLGDSYWGGKGQSGHGNPEFQQKRFDKGISFNVPASHVAGQGKTRPQDGKHPTLKPKDLCGIPWRVALALQTDGWWLRSAMPWVKRSAMPESAEDRPASALEYVFLLTKNQKYYFDMDAVRVPHSDPDRWLKKKPGNKYGGHRVPGAEKENYVTGWRIKEEAGNPSGRNFRNTDFFYQSIQPPHGMIFAGDEPVGLDVNPYPMKDAHFATFPPKLVEPCILAGTSEKGCCPECGAPWERVVEKKPSTMNIRVRDNKKGTIDKKSGIQDKYKASIAEIENYGKEQMGESKTIGWKPTCKCREPGENYYHQPIPCTVLDPFFGSGTVGTEAHKHGRNFTGIELSKTYLDDIAIPRIEKETAQMKMF